MKKTVFKTANNILFHAVSQGETPERGSPTLSISVKNLGDGIEFLRSRGFKPSSLAEYASGQGPNNDFFTISFDDAHPSVKEFAVPVLRELDVPATLFVPTKHVGETDLVMGWEEIRAISELPNWTIGSHNTSHERMSWRHYDETDDDHYCRLLTDVQSSRNHINKQLGTAPSLFAYPFGEAPEIARKAVELSGFSAAFAVAPTNQWDGDQFNIPRLDGFPGITGESASDEEDLAISVIVPACDRFDILRVVVNRLIRQSYPKDKYEILVVDDGSEQDLKTKLVDLVDLAPKRLRIIRLEGSDQTFRAGQARQAGVDAARFEIVAFLDADVAVDQDFLWHIAYCHKRDPSTVVLGYLSGYNLHDLGYIHTIEQVEKCSALTGDVLPVIPDRSREAALRQCLDDIHALDEPWKLAYTGNLSVSKMLLEKAGGFSTDFSGWGFEDVDLGLRLHQSGAFWVMSRWALGYHITEESQTKPDVIPHNPFRDTRPNLQKFQGVLKNIGTFEDLHPDHQGVFEFCRQVRDDVQEICDPPSVIGVELGAPYPFEWPFPFRLHKAHPGGLPIEDILERFEYAKKLRVRELYLLGGDVALQPALPTLFDAAQTTGVDRITIETTGIPFAFSDRAEELKKHGLCSAIVEILVGGNFPKHKEEIFEGIQRLRAQNLNLGIKLVLGYNNQDDFEKALRWMGTLDAPLYSVIAPDFYSSQWIRDLIPDEVEIEIIQNADRD